jgi:hypothetical protein
MKAHVIDPRAPSPRDAKDGRLVGLCGEEVKGVYVGVETTMRILCDACKAALERRRDVAAEAARRGPQRASADEQTPPKAGTGSSVR